MTVIEIAVALVLAIGLWGYFAGGSGTTGMTGKSPNWDAQQIAMVAYQAGFTGSDLITAVAVALAESSGNPQAVGDGGTSYGLWQIHWTVHPEFDKTQLFDPQYNANAAFALYTRNGGFRDWGAYTNGSYAQNLGAAEQAAQLVSTMNQAQLS